MTRVSGSPMRRALILGAWLACLLPSVARAGAIVCPGPNVTEGIDISEWQGSIDWAAVKSAKAYAIIRVSDGTYQDKTFNFNWATAKNVGILRGVYQFFEPGGDPIVQANLLLSKMGPMTPGMLPPMLDVEASGGQSPATIEAHIQQWVDHVKNATGRDPIIYTGSWFWNPKVQSNNQTYLPLAHAQYCNNCCPNLPAAWTTWAIWQYSSTGKVPGIGGNVDLDKWNGDLASVQKFCGLGNCKPHCEGDTIVGADCGKGNCAAYGAKCVDDNLGVRCASVFCPTQGEASVCLPDPKNAKLGSCKNGGLAIGDCSVFAGLCSSAGGQAAHCASVFCVASPQETPVQKDICLPDGQRYHCDQAGLPQTKPCAAGQKCAMVGGKAVCEGGCKPHCEGSKIVGTDCGSGDCAVYGATCVDDDLGVRCASVFCPTKGTATVCIPDPQHSKIGSCKDGGLSIGECGAYGSWCSTAFTPAKCVFAMCAAGFDQKPVVKDICLPGGKRVACDASGGITDKPCPAGQSCVLTSGGVAACSGACKPHCVGTVLVDANCGKGDCGAFAANCTDDDVGVRCTSAFCPTKGNTSVCLDFIKPGLLGTCSNGALTQASCAAGQICSAAGGKPGHCASSQCVASAKDTPVAHDLCLADGTFAHCDDAGVLTVAPCGGGEVCVAQGGTAHCQAPTCAAKCTGSVAIGVDCGKTECAAAGLTCVLDDLGARCVDPACPTKGLVQVCLAGKGPSALGVCKDGVLQTVDCAQKDAWCGLASGGATCIAKACVGGPGQAPADSVVCTDKGRVHCLVTGEAVADPCPDGTCNACGGCGAAPVELCNGLDDDCNGLIDDVPGASCGGDVADGGGTAGAGTDDAGAEQAADDAGGSQDAGGTPDGAADRDASTLDVTALHGDAQAGTAFTGSPRGGCSARGRGDPRGLLIGLALVGLVCGWRRRSRVAGSLGV
jgi:GH25 family lysozyme M1 (1,4-beta-N-acetylmuramidase)